ncbi:DNA mismatch repair protein MutS [Synechococcus sp. AH-551-E05]|nr:DNA mismatch repair protein MutS [Synechococcus sp. AH-551-E05]MDB4651371.1 DNA mismatch repair protein MutS [Synechococcus sp. AH-551-E05]
MTPGDLAVDPWPLLRNRSSASQQCAIRVVVHGRSGGAVPWCLSSFVHDLQSQRSAPVQLQALTAEACPFMPDRPLLLIPLLLWPGAHARTDVPAIRQRLRFDGGEVTMLPFLGAWPLWWSLVASFVQCQLEPGSVLVHHPLREGVADRFLRMLSASLNLPLVSFDRWPAHQTQHPEARPIPLALAPNRMTESLHQADAPSPLLEQPSIREGLLDLLACLP